MNRVKTLIRLNIPLAMNGHFSGIVVTHDGTLLLEFHSNTCQNTVGNEDWWEKIFVYITEHSEQIFFFPKFELYLLTGRN